MFELSLPLPILYEDWEDDFDDYDWDSYDTPCLIDDDE